jgi:hypothetical protein
MMLPEAAKEIQGIEDQELRKLYSKQKGHLEPKLGGLVHFPLYRALAKEAEAKDREYVEQFKQGLNIVGPVQKSFRWKEKPGNQELTVSQLDARAWEIRERVVNKLRTNPSQKHVDKIWEATIKDRDAGYCRGPFAHQQDVSQELEDQDWIPTPRFPREQKEKVRPIDDCKDNLINATTKVTEWLELASTDRNVGFIKKLYKKLAAKHGPEEAKTMIAGWVLDEADAYRQIGVNPSQMAAILKTQRLPPGQAAKLKGKLMFAASQL